MHRDIYFKFGVPFIAALCLTLFKKLAEGETPSLEDANDTALDLIMVSFGAMAAFHAGGWTTDEYTSAIVVSIFLAAILLTIRGARKRSRARVAVGATIKPVGIVVGGIELLLGCAALIVTITT